MSIYIHIEQHSILCQHQHQKVHMCNSPITGLAMQMTQTHPSTTFLLLNAKEKLTMFSFYITNLQEQSVWYYIILSIWVLVYKWVCSLWVTRRLCTHGEHLLIILDRFTKPGRVYFSCLIKGTPLQNHWWKCVYFSISQYKSYKNNNNFRSKSFFSNIMQPYTWHSTEVKYVRADHKWFVLFWSSR